MRSTRSWRLYALPAVLLFAAAPLAGAQAAKPTKQMQPADLKAWKSIRNAVLSNDGKWFAYVLAPNEGDAQLVVRSVGDGKETKYPVGNASGAGGGGRGGPPGADAGAAAGPVSISGDSKWLAFTIYPNTPPAGGRAGRGGRGGGGGG